MTIKGALTVVVCVAELLPGIESVVEELIEAVLEMVDSSVTELLTFTVNWKNADAPDARLAIVQVTEPVPPTDGVVQDQPAGDESALKVVPLGIASVTCTLLAVAGPLLLAVIV